MKIEQLLVQHFYNSKEVTLQGMGTFTLSGDFVMPKENDKDAEMPENAISFKYNPKAVADDTLIDYIVQQTRKMKSLAAADLDSYLVLGKQFLNIGKPFKIEGMGMLVKNQQGQLDFTRSNIFFAKLETTPAALREQRSNPEISFASETKTESSPKKGLLVIAAIVVLALVGTTAWYFFSKKNNNTANDSIAVTLTTDTAKTETPKTDTVAALKPVIPAPVNDGYTFKVVFLKTADSAAAAARMNMLTARHHKVIMYKKDSLLYALAEPFTLPLSDTAHIKDSLNRFYYSGKAAIELQ
jgi:hypothetical protein